MAAGRNGRSPALVSPFTIPAVSARWQEPPGCPPARASRSVRRPRRLRAAKLDGARNREQKNVPSPETQHHIRFEQSGPQDQPGRDHRAPSIPLAIPFLSSTEAATSTLIISTLAPAHAGESDGRLAPYRSHAPSFRRNSSIASRNQPTPSGTSFHRRRPIAVGEGASQSTLSFQSLHDLHKFSWTPLRLIRPIPAPW